VPLATNAALFLIDPKNFKSKLAACGTHMEHIVSVLDLFHSILR
jgi:hypothetical protein